MTTPFQRYIAESCKPGMACLLNLTMYALYNLSFKIEGSSLFTAAMGLVRLCTFLITSAISCELGYKKWLGKRLPVYRHL